MILTQAQCLQGAAIFFTFFGVQFLVAPEMLMEANFQAGSYNLDKWHLFLMRGFGILALFFCGFLWKLSDRASKYIGYVTSFMVIFSSAMPFYAQAYLPVKMPDHLLPFLGSAFLCLAHILACVAPKEGPRARAFKGGFPKLLTAKRSSMRKRRSMRRRS